VHEVLEELQHVRADLLGGLLRLGAVGVRDRRVHDHVELGGALVPGVEEGAARHGVRRVARGGAEQLEHLAELVGVEVDRQGVHVARRGDPRGPAASARLLGRALNMGWKVSL